MDNILLINITFMRKYFLFLEISMKMFFDYKNKVKIYI